MWEDDLISNFLFWFNCPLIAAAKTDAHTGRMTVRAAPDLCNIVINMDFMEPSLCMNEAVNVFSFQ